MKVKSPVKSGPCSQASILYSKCQFLSDSPRAHPSLIPPCRSRQSWTQIKIKSWPSISVNLHPSTKMIASTSSSSSLQYAQHSPHPLCSLTKKKTPLAVINKQILTFLILLKLSFWWIGANTVRKMA